MKVIITITVLSSFLLIASSYNALACHRWEPFPKDPDKGVLGGHSSNKYDIGGGSRPKSGFGITSHPTTTTGEMVLTSFMGSSDSVATTTDCNWRTSNIEKFFNESYLQIAEESSQGQGPHLEALASQVGCNAQQAMLLEKAMQQNYQDVFAKEDINHSINEFYTVINSDEQLAACWPKS